MQCKQRSCEMCTQGGAYGIRVPGCAGSLVQTCWRLGETRWVTSLKKLTVKWRSLLLNTNKPVILPQFLASVCIFSFLSVPRITRRWLMTRAVTSELENTWPWFTVENYPGIRQKVQRKYRTNLRIASLWVVISTLKLHRPRERRLSGKWLPTLRIEGATWSAWRIPAAVFSIF
jgi:hypothetical protein